MLAVDDQHCQSRRLQHLVGAEPIDAGGFHGHRVDALLFEPVAQGVELAGGGAENFRRLPGDGDVEGFAAGINAGGLRIQNRQCLHRRDLSPRRRRARSGLEKDKPTQREPRPRGVAKQTKCADRNHSLPRAAFARQRARRSHCTPQTNTPTPYQVQGHKSRLFAGRGISPRGRVALLSITQRRITANRSHIGANRRPRRALSSARL